MASLINDPQLPIQFVFAGKAHPLDQPGKQVLREIAEFARDPQFAGKVVFVEDYDMNVARHLVQGVDVWLNNPRRPLEASGTSGEKVLLNGGLNLSVLDGWWAEAYDGTNGFAIGMGETHSSVETHDQMDADGPATHAQSRRSIPLYYDRDRDGLPARLDRPDEVVDPVAGLAVQRRPDGDGLRDEVLHPRRGGHVQRHEPVLIRAPRVVRGLSCEPRRGSGCTTHGHFRTVCDGRLPSDARQIMLTLGSAERHESNGPGSAQRRHPSARGPARRDDPSPRGRGGVRTWKRRSAPRPRSCEPTRRSRRRAGSATGSARSTCRHCGP